MGTCVCKWGNDGGVTMGLTMGSGEIFYVPAQEVAHKMNDIIILPDVGIWVSLAEADPVTVVREFESGSQATGQQS